LTSVFELKGIDEPGLHSMPSVRKLSHPRRSIHAAVLELYLIHHWIGLDVLGE